MRSHSLAANANVTVLCSLIPFRVNCRSREISLTLSCGWTLADCRDSAQLTHALSQLSPLYAWAGVDCQGWWRKTRLLNKNKNKNKNIFISSRSRFTVASTSYYNLLAVYKRIIFQVHTAHPGFKGAKAWDGFHSCCCLRSAVVRGHNIAVILNVACCWRHCFCLCHCCC